jgi:tripartite-type tricarboxylate transporter receptor subunit TctC
MGTIHLPGRAIPRFAGSPLLRRTLLTFAAACALIAQGVGIAQAETYPSKQIKFIVGYPPGGGADVTGRLFAEHMSRVLNQRIIVENRTGASGTIAATSVVRSEPDGYTLLVAAISEISIVQATMKDMPYDPAKDFSPVVMFGKWAQVLVASPSFPPNSLKELIDYAKANPGKVSYASFGNNTLNHVNGERFKLAAGIDTLHVPYRGSGQSLIDVMAGVVQYTFDSPATTLGHVKAGKLKAIAVAGTERLAAAPNIPTVAEAGLPNFVIQSWIGLMAPANTPKPIVDQLNAAANKAMQSPELRQVLEGNNTQPAGGTPEEFARQIRAEIADYKQVATQVGLQQQ